MDCPLRSRPKFINACVEVVAISEEEVTVVLVVDLKFELSSRSTDRPTLADAVVVGIWVELAVDVIIVVEDVVFVESSPSRLRTMGRDGSYALPDALLVVLLLMVVEAEVVAAGVIEPACDVVDDPPRLTSRSMIAVAEVDATDEEAVVPRFGPLDVDVDVGLSGKAKTRSINALVLVTVIVLLLELVVELNVALVLVLVIVVPLLLLLLIVDVTVVVVEEEGPEVVAARDVVGKTAVDELKAVVELCPSKSIPRSKFKIPLDLVVEEAADVVKIAVVEDDVDVIATVELETKDIVDPKRSRSRSSRALEDA